MEALEQRHLETNNPIYSMLAFNHCFERSATPPAWVMKVVALSFHDYITNCGKRTLDESFQLKPGRGQDKRMTMFLLDERNEIIMREMFKLVEYIGVSMEQAAHMVSEKLKAADWNKTLVEMKELSEGTIRDMFRKSYRMQMKAQVEELDPDYADHFNEEKRTAFLTTFPAHSLPTGLK